LNIAVFVYFASESYSNAQLYSAIDDKLHDTLMQYALAWLTCWKRPLSHVSPCPVWSLLVKQSKHTYKDLLKNWVPHNTLQGHSSSDWSLTY